MTTLRNEYHRFAFRLGRQTSDTVDELKAQIKRLEEQLEFNAAEHEREIAVLLRDLMRAKYELARRDLVDAFAGEPSPSAMVH